MNVLNYRVLFFCYVTWGFTDFYDLQIKPPVRNSPDRGSALYFSVKISTAF